MEDGDGGMERDWGLGNGELKGGRMDVRRECDLWNLWSALGEKQCFPWRTFHGCKASRSSARAPRWVAAKRFCGAPGCWVREGIFGIYDRIPREKAPPPPPPPGRGGATG